MSEVVQFIRKRDLERARLILEARAINEGIFPTERGPANRSRGPLASALTATIGAASLTSFLF